MALCVKTNIMASCCCTNQKILFMPAFIPATLQARPGQLKSILLLLSLCIFSVCLFAQSVGTVISGKVQDEKGNPVSFATIRIQGTPSGTSADAEGNFSIRLKTIPSVLEVYAVSYLTAEKKITLSTPADSLHNMIIILKADTKTRLEEVVVVSAFGVKRSVRSVSSGTSVSGALAGKVSGVEVRTEKATATATGTVSGEVDKEVKNRTKLLTAGELSDFKKWKLWEGYTQSEFLSYGSKWNLYANERYSVQLQNENARAVTGQTVYLVNSNNGDTVWTAISDNTGKAELWNRFGAGAGEEEPMDIHVKGQDATYPARVFSEGINLVSMEKACTASAKVDIAFVVDATGSMGDEIDYLKEELGDILGKLTNQDPGIDLRTGAVFYRDTYDEYITRVQPLTAGTSQTIDFIKKQSAGGGGDYPEAMEKALEASIEKLQWSADARTRIIFLVLDAPPHDEAKAGLAQLIQRAAARGIRIVPVACSGTDKSTEFILRSMALATNGTYIFLTDDSGIGDKHIKPTTDEFKVELLNDLLQRVISQMCYVNTCTTKQAAELPLSTYKTMDSVKIFPNPSRGPVTLETGLKLKEILVADFTGKVLRKPEARKSKTSYRFDISDLPAATYLIRYTTEDDQSGAEKLVLLR